MSPSPGVRAPPRHGLGLGRGLPRVFGPRPARDRVNVGQQEGGPERGSPPVGPSIAHAGEASAQCGALTAFDTRLGPVLTVGDGEPVSRGRRSDEQAGPHRRG